MLVLIGLAIFILLGISTFFAYRLLQRFFNNFNNSNQYRLIIYVLSFIFLFIIVFLLFILFLARDGRIIISLLIPYSFYLILGLNFLIWWIILGIYYLTGRLVNRYNYDHNRSNNFILRFLNKIVDYFYNFNSSTPILKEKWIILRNSINLLILYYFIGTVIVIAIILLSLFFRWIGIILFTLFLFITFPSITILFLLTLRAFLGGNTALRASNSKNEFRNRVHFDYNPINHLYNVAFSDHIKQTYVYTPQELNRAYATESNNDLKLDEYTLLIKDKLQRNSLKINNNFLNLLSELNRGRNIGINTSFFSKEFEPYLLIYLQTIINEQKTILIIGKNAVQCQKIKEYLNDLDYENINILKNNELWNIETYNKSEESKDFNILIATPEWIVNSQFFNNQISFIDSLKSIIILDTQELLTNPIFIPTLLGWELDLHIKKEQVQYLFLMDFSHSKSADLLQHLFFLKNFKLLNNQGRVQGNTYVKLWNSEGDVSIQDEWLGNRTNNFYGDLLSIGAFSYDQGKLLNTEVNIIEDKNLSYLEGINNLREDSRLFTDPNRMLENINIGEAENNNQEQNFIITNDYLNNLPLLLKIYTNMTALDSTMINVVSKPYLFRDYFYSLSKEEITNSDINTTSVDMSSLNRIYHFLIKSYLKDVTESELREEVGKYLFPKIKNIPTERILLESLKRIKNNNLLGPEIVYDYFKFELNDQIFNYDDQVRREYNIRLINHDFYHDILDELKTAKLNISGTSEYYDLDILANQVHHNYLEGQILVYNGTNYFIQNIDKDNGIIYVINTEYKDRVPEYIQNKNFNFKYQTDNKDSFTLLNTVNMEGLEIKSNNRIKSFRRSIVIMQALIRVNGYTTLIDGNPTYEAPFTEIDELIYYDNYCECLILSFEVENIIPEELDNISSTLAILLQEALKTYFPNIYQYISVIPLVNDVKLDVKLQQIYPSTPYFDISNILKEDQYTINIIIAEDSPVDIGAIETIYREINSIFELLHKYLDWYLENTNNQNNSSYLEYGTGQLPDFMRSSLVIIRDITGIGIGSSRNTVIPQNNYLNHPNLRQNDVFETCSFCHESFLRTEFEILEDNKIICQNCLRQVVTTEKELNRILKESIEFLYQRYDIEEFNNDDSTVLDNTRVVFMEPADIRNQLGQNHSAYDLYNTLSYSNSHNNEIWVEKNAPENSLRAVILYELVSIWQDHNLDLNNPGLTDQIRDGQRLSTIPEYFNYSNQVELYEREINRITENNDHGSAYQEMIDRLRNNYTTDSFKIIKELFGKNN